MNLDDETDMRTGSNREWTRALNKISVATYWAHSVSFPRFWLSNIARINFLFSSRYCIRMYTHSQEKKGAFSIMFEMNEFKSVFISK